MKYISWFSTIFSVIGAFLVAGQYNLIGYICFIIGGAGWGYIGFINKDKALYTMQGIFLLANIMGLYNAL